MKDPLFPRSFDALVSFVDLAHFASVTHKLSDIEVFQMMTEVFRMLGEAIEPVGGRLVKPIGDAGLVVFPAEFADTGVLAIIAAKMAIDEYMLRLELPCRLVVKIHVGPVVEGMMGTSRNHLLDVYGKTVNVAAMLESHGISLTPQAFRSLKPSSRRMFKKHTPPIRYIPLEEHHKGSF